MPDMHGAKKAAFGPAADIERRLPWGLALFVVGALSVLSWVAVIGFIAAFRVLG